MAKADPLVTSKSVAARGQLWPLQLCRAYPNRLNMESNDCTIDDPASRGHHEAVRQELRYTAGFSRECHQSRMRGQIRVNHNSNCRCGTNNSSSSSTRRQKSEL